MQQPITIAGTTVLPGRRESLELPLPSFYTHTSASMPVQIIHGRQGGARLLVCAAIHGDEINGVEIIRRVLARKAVGRLKGTLIAIPVVNVFGFVSLSRYLPDRRDLNRAFPGSKKGSMASRLASILMEEIVDHCTHVIDLHSGSASRENFPQIRAKVIGAPETEAMARAFGAPVIIDSETRDGSLREAVYEGRRKPVLLYEAGEPLRFNEVSIRAGVEGVLGVMAHLGMIRKRSKRKFESVITRTTQWVRAGQSGILRSVTSLGARVDSGDLLAYIGDHLGENQQELVSPISGIVIGKKNLPLVYEGEAVFNIARYAEADEVSNHIESYREEFDPLSAEAEADDYPLT